MSPTANKGATPKVSPLQGLLVVLLAALLSALAYNFFLLNERNQQETATLARTTTIQVEGLTLARTVEQFGRGEWDVLRDLETLRARLDRAVTSLRHGDLGLATAPAPASAEDWLARLEQAWGRVDGDAGALLDRADQLNTLIAAAGRFKTELPRLHNAAEEASGRLVETGANAVQVQAATRQLALADRMLGAVDALLAGDGEALQAGDSLRSNAERFGQVMTGLIEGDPERALTAVDDSGARTALDETNEIFTGLQSDINIILAASTDLIETRRLAGEVGHNAETLAELAASLAAEYGALGEETLWPSLLAGIVLASGTLLVLVWLGLSAYRAQRRTARLTTAANQRNQDAILRLLDEMSSLADGDLTVQATVTEDVPGAIADSVNYAVEALRDLVAGVNSTARQVAAQAQETRATTMQLAEASQHQAREIGKASDHVNTMAQSFDDMAQRSSESAEVAQNSVEIANRGADMVRQTIAGMDNIRNQIQETSKRIKRLGESSQEIGDIVELINGLSEQTNVLALNAAIQAASAGGAGRGFAVVADEVQRLAERATDATRRIEALVKTIQSDTSEAVNSMEETTSQVVSGAGLAEDAGEALESIERVSNDLAGLIQNISHQAQEESRNATRIAEMMNAIRDISVQSSEGTGQTAASVANLAELVRKLRESVSDFTLPEDGSA